MSNQTKQNTQKGKQVRLKFTKSSKNNSYIAFIVIDKHGKAIGVKEDDPRDKKICVVDGALNSKVIAGALYKCRIISMANRKGYIAHHLELVQYPATFTIDYKPKVSYKLTVSFGHKSITYNPFNARNKCERFLTTTLQALKERVDVLDLPGVVEKFERQAMILDMRLKADHFLILG